MMSSLQRLKQDEIEKRLQKKTDEALERIAQALDISPDVYEDKYPKVIYEPDRNTSSSNFIMEYIVYASECAEHLGEETGHYLRNLYRDSNPVTRPVADEVPDGIARFLQNTLYGYGFLAEALNEAIGYFCSLLFVKTRYDTFNHLCTTLEIVKEAKENHTGKPEALFNERLPVQYLQECAGTLLGYNTEQFRFLEEVVEGGLAINEMVRVLIPSELEDDLLYESFIEKVDGAETSNCRSELLNTPVEQFRGLRSELKLLFTLPNGVFEKVNNVFGWGISSQNSDKKKWGHLTHWLGYDVGDALYRLYQFDKELGASLVREIMVTPQWEAYCTFIEVHRTLNNYGFSPIFQ